MWCFAMEINRLESFDNFPIKRELVPSLKKLLGGRIEMISDEEYKDIK